MTTLDTSDPERLRAVIETAMKSANLVTLMFVDLDADRDNVTIVRTTPGAMSDLILSERKPQQ